MNQLNNADFITIFFYLKSQNIKIISLIIIIRCSLKDMYSVFADVSKYLSWISYIMKV